MGKIQNRDMLLTEDVKNMLENFDVIPSENIIKALEQIKSEMKNNLTQEYLGQKIDGVKKAYTEDEKKKMCKNLKPYLDWHIQGN